MSGIFFANIFSQSMMYFLLKTTNSVQVVYALHWYVITYIYNSKTGSRARVFSVSLIVPVQSFACIEIFNNDELTN